MVKLCVFAIMVLIRVIVLMGFCSFFHNLRGKKKKKKKRDNFIFVLYHGFDQDYSSNGFVYLIMFVLAFIF